MLTDTALRNLKPKSKIYKASDRDGMYVIGTSCRPSRTGRSTKSWPMTRAPCAIRWRRAVRPPRRYTRGRLQVRAVQPAEPLRA
jgi:hypothetical protein